MFLRKESGEKKSCNQAEMLFLIKQRCSFENQNLCSHCKPKQMRLGGGWGGEGTGEGSQAERGGRGMDTRGGVGLGVGVSQVQEIAQKESKKLKHKKVYQY